MEWVETTGRTVEEALEVALDELGVDEAEVEYEVLVTPKSGLFGRIGGNDARIRARVKPLSREKPGERQRRNRRGGPGQTRGRSRDGSQAASRPAADGESPVDGAEPAAAAAPAGVGRSQRRSRRGGQRHGGGAGPREAGETRTVEAATASKGSAVETIEPEVTIEEQAEAAEAFTRGVVDAFDLGAEVRSVIVDDGILVDVTGEGLGLLVGPRGATLTALEELVRTVVQRQTDGQGVRINVDVAGYRSKRREALERFTRGIADRVLETGRAQALEPMSASDRKVVHDVAAEIDGVASESEGEEPRRRVVLVPAAPTASESS